MKDWEKQKLEALEKAAEHYIGNFPDSTDAENFREALAITGEPPNYRIADCCSVCRWRVNNGQRCSKYDTDVQINATCNDFEREE